MGVNLTCEKCGHLYNSEKFESCPNCPDQTEPEQTTEESEA